MMNVMVGAILMAGVQSVAPPQAQQNIQVTAQALDRCMATYAVRLTKTPASDDAIFAEATRSCAPLNEALTTALNTQLPPAQANAFIKQMDASARPNFMTMLARIRHDRASKPAN